MADYGRKNIQVTAPKMRQLTMTIEYPVQEEWPDAATVIMYYISSNIYDLNRKQFYMNQNKALPSIKANITGVWVEPDEVPIEKQNEMLENITTNSIESKL